MESYIYWTDEAKDSYLYGSRIWINDRLVHFQNQLVPPGTVLKKWESETNYQLHRTSPSLPLLLQGRDYHIRLLAHVEPANTLYVKVTCWNPSGEEIQSVILRDGEDSFSYPEEAYRYQVELINAGCESFEFEALHLFEETSEEIINGQFYAPQGQSCLSLVFVENPMEERIVPNRLFQQIGDLLVFSDSAAAKNDYMEDDFPAFVKERVAALEGDYATIRLLGYGPKSNTAALYYATVFGKSIAYVTNEWPQDGKGFTVSSKLRHDFSEKFVSYAVGNHSDPSVWSLVSPLYQGLERLSALPFLKESLNYDPIKN